jgi:flagellar biosynthesis/type III secretory pathway protein FliH
MKRIRDEKVKLIDAKVEGRAEGRAEGLAEGRAEERSQIIKQLYQSGMSADTIASMLNRPLADIEALLRQ